MSEEIKNTEEQPTNSTPEDNGGQGGEKMFTQEEVNAIVRDRLAKERSKQRTPAEPTEAEKQEAALTARERRLDCREYLASSGCPAELLDAFDTSDVGQFKKAVDIVSGLITRREPFVPAPLYDPEHAFAEPVVTGFEAGSKHKPKQYSNRYNE